MSSLINPPEAADGRPPPEGAPAAAGRSPIRAGAGEVRPAAVSLSPGRRAWKRFRRNKLGFYSLVLFCTMVLLSLAAELVSNDRPLIVKYEGSFYFPMLKAYPEKVFGGDFETPADYLDPFIRDKLTKGDNWAVFAPNPYGPKTLNYFAKEPNPSRPTLANLFGTDDRGRDLLAQLIYGFRVSVLFALALTVTGTCWASSPARFRAFSAARSIWPFSVSWKSGDRCRSCIC